MTKQQFWMTGKLVSKLNTPKLAKLLSDLKDNLK